jgi:hypothetical protein
MKALRSGALVAIGLAVGIALGAAGSTLAGDPTARPDPSAGPRGVVMMSGAGMMGAGSVPMMQGVDPTAVQAMLDACDQVHDAVAPSSGWEAMHDAMHDWMTSRFEAPQSAAPSPSTP